MYGEPAVRHHSVNSALVRELAPKSQRHSGAGSYSSLTLSQKKMCFQLPSKRAHAATISCGNAEQIADFHSSTYSEPMQRDTEAKTTLQSIPFSKL